MNTKQAVSARILKYCQERDLAVNALANSAGIPPSQECAAPLAHQADAWTSGSAVLRDGTEGKPYTAVFGSPSCLSGAKHCVKMHIMYPM